MENISISQASHDQLMNEDLVLRLHFVEVRRTFVSAHMYSSRVYIHRVQVHYTAGLLLC